MADHWPRCTSCGSRLPEGAPGTPITTPIPPPPVGLLRIIESHVGAMRGRGRTPRAVLIHEQEADRWSAVGATTVFGIPLERDASVPLGRYRMRLDDGTLQEVLLPVYFTED